MSYHTHMRGEIRIEPPIPWHLIKDSKYLPDRHADYWGDLNFVLEQEIVDTEHGRLTVISAVAIRSDGDERRGGRAFTGRIDGEGEESTDLWRLKVVDGKAVKFVPEIVWPEASE